MNYVEPTIRFFSGKSKGANPDGRKRLEELRMYSNTHRVEIHIDQSSGQPIVNIERRDER